MKRRIATIIAICLLVSFCSTAFGCDENQTSTYVTQILFGDIINIVFIIQLRGKEAQNNETVHPNTHSSFLTFFQYRC